MQKKQMNICKILHEPNPDVNRPTCAGWTREPAPTAWLHVSLLALRRTLLRSTVKIRTRLSRTQTLNVATSPKGKGDAAGHSLP